MTTYTLEQEVVKRWDSKEKRQVRVVIHHFTFYDRGRTWKETAEPADQETFLKMTYSS